MCSRIEEIRKNERISHTKMYTSEALYDTESWLKKPIRTVKEILPLFADYSGLRVLDLGCGIGRNSIFIAETFRNKQCRIDCVDLLEIAIEKLRQNAKERGVQESINGIVETIENYEIAPNAYDLIMAVSALEHVDSEAVFVDKLREIKRGLRDRGIVCLVINSDVQEINADNLAPLEPQFEVNLSTEKVQACIDSFFSSWDVLKRTVSAQEYDVPRGEITSRLRTQAVTYVARRPR